MVQDGWHKIKEYNVWVESGRVRRGMKRDNNGSLVAAYPYRYIGQGWGLEQGVLFTTLKSGIQHGNWIMA